jgi:hypothetical protein
MKNAIHCEAASAEKPQLATGLSRAKLAKGVKEEKYNIRTWRSWRALREAVPNPDPSW